MESAETKTIEIVINGQPRRVPEGVNVLQLLESLGIDPSRVAVELNREIVHKADWEAITVKEGSTAEVVWFVGGGSTALQSSAAAKSSRSS